MDDKPTRPVTVPGIRQAKIDGRKLAMITAYDATSAKIADESGVDMILVGDSVGMVVQGHSTSLPVTLGEMIYHTKCVVRGVKRALVVADLPFLSYQVSPQQAVRSAGKLLKAGAGAVKLEGGVRMLPAVQACLAADIPVMGHSGLTPQSVHQLGGFKVQRNVDSLLDDAKTLELAGVFSMVIEAIPKAIGLKLTTSVNIPTIGIGAGPHCDGQVLVWHDLLGLYDAFRPKFVKRYADMGTQAREAIRAYCTEVRSGQFPAAEHCFD